MGSHRRIKESASKQFADVVYCIEIVRCVHRFMRGVRKIAIKDRNYIEMFRVVKEGKERKGELGVKWLKLITGNSRQMCGATHQIGVP